MQHSEENIKSISAESDDKLTVVTSLRGSSRESQSNITVEDKEALSHQSAIDAKLRFYESECKRYGIQKINLIQRCIGEELGTETFNLDDYAVGTLQCQIMFESFTRLPLTPLKRISLKNNKIEHSCCHAINRFVAMTSSLRSLNLEGCMFGDEGAKILSASIAFSTTITHLNIAHCNISDDGGEALVKALHTNDACTELNLSFNSLALKTSLAFEKVLVTNQTLQKLDLSHNSFYEDNAIVNFLNGLQQNESLEYLDLSWNALCGEPFGKVLSKSIRLSKLKILKINHNRMGAFELKKLGLGIKYSKTIDEVHLGENLFAEGSDAFLINVFNSESPLTMMSFEKWFHLSQEAFKLLQEVQATKPFANVVYNNVLLPNPPRSVNMLDIYADRAKHLAMSPKKKKLQRELRFFMMQLKDLPTAHILKPDVLNLLKNFHAKTDDALMEQYMEACLVPGEAKKRVDVHFMANHYLNRHPSLPKPSET